MWLEGVSFRRMLAGCGCLFLVHLTSRSCFPGPTQPQWRMLPGGCTRRPSARKSLHVSAAWRSGSCCSYTRVMMLAAVEEEPDSNAPSSLCHRKVWCRASSRRDPAPGHTCKRTISYLEGSWGSVTASNLTCVENVAGFVSFVVGKDQVTQQSKRRFYLELLLEPGSKPWYVVVVVILLKKRKKEKKKIWKCLKCGRIIYENYTFSSVFYGLIIVCPRWCFCLLSLTETEPSWSTSFRRNFKINRVRLGGKYLDVFCIHIIYTKLYLTSC